MKDLKGKTAFVTGGASGIGLGMTQCFLREGMNVVVADLSEEHRAQAREQLAAHGGQVHFIALDNVSDPGARLGAAQLAWLRAELGSRTAGEPVVVLTHRPLFDLAPQWDWATRDGAAALELLMTRPHVTVFYGHIHQVHHHTTGRIAHHSANSLIFPLPAPGSQEKKAPLPWDPDAPLHGLGFREIEAAPRSAEYALREFPLVRA